MLRSCFLLPLKEHPLIPINAYISLRFTLTQLTPFSLRSLIPHPYNHRISGPLLRSIWIYLLEKQLIYIQTPDKT